MINEFLETWDCEKNTGLLKHLHEFFSLYDVDEDDDWMKKDVGEEDLQNVRLIRTVYLLSRISDLYSGAFVSLKYQFPSLWKKIEDKE